MNHSISKHLQMLKKLSTDALQAPITQVMVLTTVLGSTSALIKELCTSEKPQTIVHKANTSSNTQKNYLPEKVVKVFPKYASQNMLHIDAQDKLTLSELWDLTHQLPQYWDYHEQREEIASENTFHNIHTLDTTETNSLLEKYGLQTRALNAQEMNTLLLKRNITPIKSTIRIKERGLRPSTAPLGVVLHVTDNSNYNSPSIIAGNVHHFGKGQESVHFIISRQGDLIQTAPLDAPSTAAPLIIYDSKNQPIRRNEKNPNALLFDRFLDTFFINIELIGDVHGNGNQPIDSIMTKEQQDTLFDLLFAFQKEFKFPTENITGHLEGSALSIGKEFFPKWIAQKTQKEIQRACTQIPASGYPRKLDSTFPNEVTNTTLPDSCPHIVGNAYMHARPKGVSSANWSPHADISHTEATEIRAKYIATKF